MGWEILELKLATNGRTVSAFQFEIAAEGAGEAGRRTISGDGVVFEDGRVRYNREQELRLAISGAGIDPQGCLGQLSRRVIEHAVNVRSVA